MSYCAHISLNSISFNLIFGNIVPKKNRLPIPPPNSFRISSSKFRSMSEYKCIYVYEYMHIYIYISQPKCICIYEYNKVRMRWGSLLYLSICIKNLHLYLSIIMWWMTFNCGAKSSSVMLFFGPHSDVCTFCQMLCYFSTLKCRVTIEGPSIVTMCSYVYSNFTQLHSKFCSIWKSTMKSYKLECFSIVWRL